MHAKNKDLAIVFFFFLSCNEYFSATGKLSLKVKRVFNVKNNFVKFLFCFRTKHNRNSFSIIYQVTSVPNMCNIIEVQ